MSRATYRQLQEEINEHNRRQSNTNVMTEYHESGIYSIMIDGKTVKITGLSDAISCVAFLNNYRLHAAERTGGIPLCQN